MTKFRFPLERVLALRRIDRDRETAKLQASMSAQRAVEEKLQKLDRERDLSRRETLLAGPVEASEVAGASRWRTDLRTLRDREAVELAAACRRTAEHRQAAIRAERRVKLLERLESVQRKEWRSAADRELEATAQELWLARWRKPGG